MDPARWGRVGLAVAALAGACGGERDGRGGGGGESVDRVTVVLEDQDAVSAARRRGGAPEDSLARACSVRDGAMAGVCITPDSARGWAEKVGLSPAGNSNPASCGPGRLLAVNGFTDVGGPPRGGGPFDLEDTMPIGGQSNLECEQYRDVTWGALSVTMPYLDVDFVAGARRFTVRFVFESNPITLEAPVAGCGLDPGYVAQYEYKPGVELHRGDVLACVADVSAAPCEDADFRFVDLDGASLVAARPANPLTLAFMEAMEVASAPNLVEGDIWCRNDCERGEPNCGFSTGPYATGFTLPQLGLWAEWVTSDDPRHPGGSSGADGGPDSGPDGGPDGGLDGGPGGETTGPAKLYHVAASGSERAGFEPQFTIGFDLTDMLFLSVPSDTAVDQLGEIEILTALQLRDMANRTGPHDFGTAPVQAASLEVAFGSSL